MKKTTHHHQHISLIEIIRNRHDIFVKIIQLHLSKAEHHMTQPGAILYLPLEDLLSPVDQDDAIDDLDLKLIVD